MDPLLNTRCQPNLGILDAKQIAEIHRATLQILETIGVKVLHEEAVDLLREAGCRVGAENIVRIPGWLVEECMRSVPSSITIYDRQGNEAMRLEDHNSFFGLGTDLVQTCDLDTQELRPSRLGDVRNAARVADYCSDVDFIASFALPAEAPPNTMYIHCMKEMLENSTKPVFFTSASVDDLAIITEMAAIVAGGEQALRDTPFIIHYSEPTPPLRHSSSGVRKLLFCAEKGIPICYTPGSTMGGTAPVTLAGAIVQANAEALSGIVMHQLKQKGAPIISGLGGLPLDMRTTICSYGAPSSRLLISASAALYHHYNIPVWSTLGSDSISLDAQSGIEHAFGVLMAILDGANLIHDTGYLAQGLVGNPAMILMCNEIVSYCRRVLRGFTIDREAMGIETIEKVAAGGGSYITEKHTLQRFREELWQPILFNRDNTTTWVNKGSRTYEDALLEKTREILAQHEPKKLAHDVSKKLDACLADAESTLSDVTFIT